MKSGNLNFLEPSGPLQAWNGTALPFAFKPKLMPRLWVRIPPGHGCLSVVSVLCCQVEVSATSLSLVQRKSDCAAPMCNLETSWMRRPWPTGGAAAPKTQTPMLIAVLGCVYANYNRTHRKIYQPTNQLTYSLTPCSGDLLEKLTGSQPIKRYCALYGTERFITAFTRARYLSLWARSIHCLLQSHRLKIHCHINLTSTPGSSKWPLSIRFPHQNPVYTSHSSWFDHPRKIRWAQIIKILIMYSSTVTHTHIHAL